ncbi:MAG TPA: FAD-binding protein, partial [Ktedonobacterales bacterium]|nr:FAD-binding protein [Ktedonobacterales bacterium]
MDDLISKQSVGAASLPPRVIQALRAIVGPEYVLRDPEDLLAYGIDGTWVEREPQVVVLPQSAEEISAILRLANAERVVVTPRGSASGLSGGALAASG